MAASSRIPCTSTRDTGDPDGGTRMGRADLVKQFLAAVHVPQAFGLPRLRPADLSLNSPPLGTGSKEFAPLRNRIRQGPEGLYLRDRPGRNRHLLAMSPTP